MKRVTGFAAALAVAGAAPAGAQTTVHDAATFFKAASEAYVRFLDRYLRGAAPAKPAN